MQKMFLGKRRQYTLYNIYFTDATDGATVEKAKLSSRRVDVYNYCGQNVISNEVRKGRGSRSSLHGKWSVFDCMQTVDCIKKHVSYSLRQLFQDAYGLNGTTIYAPEWGGLHKTPSIFAYSKVDLQSILKRK